MSGVSPGLQNSPEAGAHLVCFITNLYMLTLAAFIMTREVLGGASEYKLWGSSASRARPADPP